MALIKNKYNLGLDDFTEKETFTFDGFYIYTMWSFALVVFLIIVNITAYTSNEQGLFLVANLTINAVILGSILLTSGQIVTSMQRYRNKLNLIRAESKAHRELDDKLKIFSKDIYVCIAHLVYQSATIFIILTVAHMFEFGTVFHLTIVYTGVKIPYCINIVRNCLLYNSLIPNEN